jgi:hypothetical protein
MKLLAQTVFVAASASHSLGFITIRPVLRGVDISGKKICSICYLQNDDIMCNNDISGRNNRRRFLDILVTTSSFGYFSTFVAATPASAGETTQNSATISQGPRNQRMGGLASKIRSIGVVMVCVLSGSTVFPLIHNCKISLLCMY